MTAAAQSLGRREARLARLMLAPTVATVMTAVLLPLAATFWISVKPIELADLRPPAAIARERFRSEPATPGDAVAVEYRLRNSSPRHPVRQIELRDAWPAGWIPENLDARCTILQEELACDLGEWPPAYRERLTVRAVASAAWFDNPASPTDSPPAISFESDSPLASADFTLQNFAAVFDSGQFITTLQITFFYTFFGTAGALLLGLFAAQLLNQPFRGRALFRGLFLFPYVAPVIAMAYTWLVLLNPSSGALNALLERMGTIDGPINFFGSRIAEAEILGMQVEFPLALIMVTAFEAWRYFPLAMLFVLARMQSEPPEMREAAEMDGASPLQQFRHLSLPHLAGVLSALFLLRFIWTFNKFDDIFLLTGGAAGTRTLTVSVYERGFALGDLGAGCAVAAVIFALLLAFSALHFRFLSREEGL